MSVPNYKKKYLDEVRPHLMKKFEFTSIMQVPKIEKITLNIGIGNAKDNKKALQSALEELMLITGQKPVVTTCLLYTSPSPRDGRISRMPSSA